MGSALLAFLLPPQFPRPASRLPAWGAIGLSAAIFGLFHASAGGLIAVERILSSTLLGVALGALCWTTRSVFPGVVLHAVSNSMMISLMYLADQLGSWGYDVDRQRYLPPSTTIERERCLGAQRLFTRPGTGHL